MEFKPKDVLHILHIAKLYEVNLLAKSCRNYVHGILSKDTAIELWESAVPLGENLIAERCCKIFSESTDIVTAHRISEISFELLVQILNMDVVSVEEIELFKLCQKWIFLHQPTKEKQDKILGLIRVPVISVVALLLNFLECVFLASPCRNCIQSLKGECFYNFFCRNKF